MHLLHQLWHHRVLRHNCFSVRTTLGWIINPSIVNIEVECSCGKVWKFK